MFSIWFPSHKLTVKILKKRKFLIWRSQYLVFKVFALFAGKDGSPLFLSRKRNCRRRWEWLSLHWRPHLLVLHRYQWLRIFWQNKVCSKTITYDIHQSFIILWHNQSGFWITHNFTCKPKKRQPWSNPKDPLDDQIDRLFSEICPNLKCIDLSVTYSISLVEISKTTTQKHMMHWVCTYLSNVDWGVLTSFPYTPQDTKTIGGTRIFWMGLATIFGNSFPQY